MEQLGIQPSLLVAQLVNFSIIAFVLTKLLFKPILEMLDKRRKEIEEGLKLTEKMRLAEEETAKKRDKIMDTARREGREFLEQVKKDAKKEEHDILESAHKEAESILEKARKETVKIHDDMMVSVKREAVDLAVAMTKRLTADMLSQSQQHEFIAAQVKKLETLKV